MIQTPLTVTKDQGVCQGDSREYQVHTSNQYHATNNDFKLPSRKEKDGLLLRYAKKLGLNDRGCYLAIGLSMFTFLLIIIIIIMAACWPGNVQGPRR